MAPQLLIFSIYNEIIVYIKDLCGIINSDIKNYLDTYLNFTGVSEKCLPLPIFFEGFVTTETISKEALHFSSVGFENSVFPKKIIFIKLFGVFCPHQFKSFTMLKQISRSGIIGN